MTVLLVLLGLLAVGLIFFYGIMQPTNKGPWKRELERLARADIRGDSVAISNFRRARYSPKAVPETIDWVDREVRLSDLKEVWFGLSVFQKPGLAHTFLSFDFGDGDPLCVSVEARQRPGQKYHPLSGFLHQYHIIYIVGDEPDIVGVRTYSRANEVHFQPLVLGEERAKALFLDMFSRLNDLTTHPRFYNTLLSNCTTSLLKESVVPTWQKILDWRLLLPGFSDRVAYEFGILDQRYSCAALRHAAYLGDTEIDPTAEDFSDQLRASFYRRLPKDEAGER